MKLSGKWYQMLPNVCRFGNHKNDTGDHQRIFYTISNDYSIDQNCEIRIEPIEIVRHENREDIKYKVKCQLLATFFLLFFLPPYEWF